jgi:hypothetical protein
MTILHSPFTTSIGFFDTSARQYLQTTDREREPSRDDDKHHRTALVGGRHMPSSNGASAYTVRDGEK